MKGGFMYGLGAGLVVGMLAISYSDDASRLIEKGKKAVKKKLA